MAKRLCSPREDVLPRETTVNVAFTTWFSRRSIENYNVVGKRRGRERRVERNYTRWEYTLPAKFDRLPSSLSPGFTMRLWKSLATRLGGRRRLLLSRRSPPRFLPGCSTKLVIAWGSPTFRLAGLAGLARFVSILNRFSVANVWQFRQFTGQRRRKRGEDW